MELHSLLSLASSAMDTYTNLFTDETSFKVLCSGKSMKIDEACLTLHNSRRHQVSFNWQTAECDHCNYLRGFDVPQWSHFSTILPTTSLSKIAINASDHSVICSFDYKFQQHGIYGLNITSNNCSSVFVVEPPDYADKPLWVLVSILFFTSFFWSAISLTGCASWFVNRYVHRIRTEVSTDLGTSSDAVPLVRAEYASNDSRCKFRILMLDTFRGITMALMIFVNYGGGRYVYFKHAPWNGLTVADVVFPWFAFIMGVGLTFSIRTHLRNYTYRRKVVFKVLHRSLLLFLLGVILNSKSNNDLRTLRIPGVLQRLACAYFIVAVIETVFMTPQNMRRNLGRFTVIEDLINSWKQWLSIVVLVTIHCLITFKLPVPGCPTGYLGPGGFHMEGLYHNCTGGAAGYIDRRILTPHHMYNRSTPRLIYETTVRFDPEGILGVLTTCLTVFLGVQAARIYMSFHTTQERVSRWLIWAIITGILGGCLCGWHREDGFIPINKNLWSLSYVFVTASLAFALVSVLYILNDHSRVWSGWPFNSAGKNPILIYIGSELTNNLFPWSWKPITVFRYSHTEVLVMNFFGTFLWLLIGRVLDKHHVYFSI